MLAEADVAVLAPTDLDVDWDPPEETGLTFIENALIKARVASSVTGLPVIAEDSGLVVDALGGRPGVRSARFAGPKASDTANTEALLRLLEAVRDPRPIAHFYCVMVYLRSPIDPAPILSEGVWTGHILKTPQGLGGFGYDPVFGVSGLGLSAAELSTADKNRLSHRGQALRALLSKCEALGW